MMVNVQLTEQEAELLIAALPNLKDVTEDFLMEVERLDAYLRRVFRAQDLDIKTPEWSSEEVLRRLKVTPTLIKDDKEVYSC